MKVNERIKSIRESLGIPQDHLVQKLGININWYWDLEAYDHEFETTLSLSQAKTLATELKTSISNLIFGADILKSPTLGFIEIEALLHKKRAEIGISNEEMEDQVGWELQDFFGSPQKRWEYNLDWAKDVASFLNVPYESIVHGIDKEKMN